MYIGIDSLSSPLRRQVTNSPLKCQLLCDGEPGPHRSEPGNSPDDYIQNTKPCIAIGQHTPYSFARVPKERVKKLTPFFNITLFNPFAYNTLRWDISCKIIDLNVLINNTCKPTLGLLPT